MTDLQITVALLIWSGAVALAYSIIKGDWE